MLTFNVLLLTFYALLLTFDVLMLCSTCCCCCLLRYVQSPLLASPAAQIEGGCLKGVGTSSQILGLLAQQICEH